MLLDTQQELLIAQGLREGKAEAWQALYDAFAERVWQGVARLLGPGGGTDVADVVQETMIAAARSAVTFDPARGSLWSWLWGIAHNHLALQYRRREQQQRLLAAVVAADNGQARRWLESKEPSPPEALAAAELAVLVRSALTALPTEYEMLLTARYLDGDTVSVIAERERSTEMAVRSKLARARQTFREAFAQHAQS